MCNELSVDGKLIAISLGSVHHRWQGANYNIEVLCVLSLHVSLFKSNKT